MQSESNQSETFNIDPTVLTGVSLVFEKVIAKALAHDPGTLRSIGTLAPLSIHVETSEPCIHFLVAIDERSEISVEIHQPGYFRVRKEEKINKSSDIHIKGKLSDFVALATSNDYMLAKHNISVSGKIHQLGKLQDIAKNLDIDWEEPIVALLGVVPGHFVSERIRAAVKWTRYQQNEIKHWFPETLQEELRLTPPRTEVEDFFNNIDTVNALTQRLDARISRLKKRIDKV